MKVYIVKRDVPYEFGDVYEVCATRVLAEKRMKHFIGEHGDDEDWSVQEWEVIFEEKV